MLPVLLILTSTFALEASMSLGKRYIAQRRETAVDMGFLGMFWALAFLLVTLAFGAEFRVTLASLPTLALRVVLDSIMLFTLVEATVKADRTTMAFLRLLTIPLLLVVDIGLGYNITNVQIAGIVLLFFAMVLAFRHDARSRRGSWMAVFSAILAVATISLYKYDITHFNSVVGEQTVVISAVLVIFYVMARLRGRSPLRLLVKPTTGTQSMATGVSIALESFAMSFAPASIIITLKRSFAIFWAIIFGGVLFHEHSLGRKVASGGLLVISLFLITTPLIHL